MTASACSRREQRTVSSVARGEDGRLPARHHRRHPDRDRRTPRAPGVDPWWSGQHHSHGGTIQVAPLLTAGHCGPRRSRPGREHDTTALREHPRMLVPAVWTEDLLDDWTTKVRPTSSPSRSRNPRGGEPTDVQQTYNKVHNGIRTVGEGGNSLLKTTFKAPRNVSLCRPHDRRRGRSTTDGSAAVFGFVTHPDLSSTPTGIWPPGARPTRRPTRSARQRVSRVAD